MSRSTSIPYFFNHLVTGDSISGWFGRGALLTRHIFAQQAKGRSSIFFVLSHRGGEGVSRSTTATTAFNRHKPNKTCMFAYTLFGLQFTVFRAIHDTWAGKERIEDLMPANLSKVKGFIL